MAKKIFVRSLTTEETEYIDSMMSSQVPYQRVRATVIKFSSQGYSAPEIVEIANLHLNNVRKWINSFNKEGISIFTHKNTGKTPRQKFTKEIFDKIVSVALSRPRELGMTFTTWTLSKLKGYIEENNIIKEISTETLRTTLLSREISFQKTKAWLHSTDPQYQQKKDDIMSLYNNPPKDGIVLCYDEKGTITAKQYQGSGWTKEQIKARLHYRIKGKTELFATYNPHSKEVVLMFDVKKN